MRTQIGGLGMRRRTLFESRYHVKAKRKMWLAVIAIAILQCFLGFLIATIPYWWNLISVWSWKLVQLQQFFFKKFFFLIVSHRRYQHDRSVERSLRTLRLTFSEVIKFKLCRNVQFKCCRRGERLMWRR